MRLLLKPYFIILCLIYCINKYFQLSFNEDTSSQLFLKNHLNDLLYTPIVLTLCLAIVRVVKRQPNQLINVYLTGFMSLFFALIFEFIGPKVYIHSVGDWIDVLMYSLGGILFMFFQKWFVTKT